MIILLLLPVAFIIAGIGFIIRRNYKMSVVMMIPIVLLFFGYVWYFTSILFDIGIRQRPSIEFLRIRHATAYEMQTFLFDTDYPLYIVELSSDASLDKYGGSDLRMFCLPMKPDFDYEDIVVRDSARVMESFHVEFVEERRGRYLYQVPLQLMHSDFNMTYRKAVSLSEIKGDLHCKIFGINMLVVPLSTSEMVIPFDSLKKVVGHE